MHRRLLLSATRLSLSLAAFLAIEATVPSGAWAQGARDNIDALIEEQAKASGVPASFVHQVVKRESNYNPNAKGGSALGLMQIKHATARSLGYTGDAAGLYDPRTNLRYGVAYLAGAYRTAKGNVAQAYQYYNRGYYYAAKRQGVSTEVAAVVAPAAATASAFASLFIPRSTDLDPNATVAATAISANSAALAYAPAPTEVVDVPLPPRRPVGLGAPTAIATLDAGTTTAPQPVVPPDSLRGTDTQADAASASPIEVPLPPRRPAAFTQTLQVASLTTVPTPAAAEAPGGAMLEAAPPVTVAVPLPPRRPSAEKLALAAPTPVRKPAEPVLEASALPAVP